MMASLFLTTPEEDASWRVSTFTERGHRYAFESYGQPRRHTQKRFVTLLVFLMTLALSGYLFVIIPEVSRDGMPR